MKKVLAAVIVSTLLWLPTNVVADTSSPSPLTISFEMLEAEISENNISVQVADRLLDKLDHAYDYREDQISLEMDSAQGQLNFQIAQMDGQVASYNSFIDIYTKIRDGSVDPAVIADCNAKIEIFNMAKNSVAAVKAELQDQLDELDDLEEDLEDELDEDYDLDKQQARSQIALNRDSQIYLAQKNYLGYFTLAPKVQEARNQLDLLNKKQDVSKLMVCLGMTTQAELELLQAGLQNAELAAESLERNLNDIKGNLNLALGRAYDDELILTALADLDQEKIRDVNYEEDLESVLSENYNLKLMEIDLDKKDNEVDRADERSAEEMAEIDYENLELQIEDLKRKIEFTFNQAANDLTSKEDALAAGLTSFNTSQTTWNFAALKYDLGMISHLDYLAAKNEYETAQHQYKSAQQSLLEAYTDYQWAVEGLIPSLSQK